MFTDSHYHRRGTRRGVVLILVLGMLGLMAMIGIMFASYSGQAEINARNYALSKSAPDPSSILDFALAQLINDTDNPMSALRGHSLKRDMYGNDALNNGFLAGRPGNNASFFVETAVGLPPGPSGGLWRLRTNIPYDDTAFAGYNFTRWTLKLSKPSNGPRAVTQSFEILVDDTTNADGSGKRVFTVNAPDDVTLWTNHTNGTTVGLQQPLPTPTPPGIPFVLDGRYLRAFNGPGFGAKAVYANFGRNGTLLDPTATTALGNPNAVGMDEDYDACDLENWFLAIQSADGQVIVPSFHRPGILRANQAAPKYPNDDITATATNDWRNTSFDSAARFLRPRAADGHSAISFPDLIPDATGKITFDVDNDGDGIADAVWLDLGYPATRNASGRLQKPLFAFTVIGLNGRIPLNIAGNLQRRNDAGVPLFTHASHLGNSPSEVDPTYALQNAVAAGYSQVDDADVPVALTQLRQLLAGTRLAGTGNGDANTVSIGGQPYLFPNNVVDARDTPPGGPVNRDTSPVEGRWGEGDFIPTRLTNNILAVAEDYRDNLVRAGLSRLSHLDSRDDNFNSFDPNGESADLLDAAGAPRLRVEGIRRFVTPIDLAGDGLVSRWGVPAANTGADEWGRVSFTRYFRPPGVPLRFDAATGFFALPAGSSTKDVTTNLLHGYEANRNPKLPNAQLFAGMPYNLPGPPPAAASTTSSTYDQTINSDLLLAGLNEADEMALYMPNTKDAPFGPRDLEWLYRNQDIDGSSIDSRLAQLAPISFTNPVDGMRRRRMFSLDSWELNNFVWANDNPGNVFETNSRFKELANASFPNLRQANSENPAGSASTRDPLTGPDFLPIGAPDGRPEMLTPALAHGGRKMNLNYPLPVSNEPGEPVRQKWIRDTYQMLKAILPPRAVDTPEELAQLSQFVVNVIDFRDPDCTMTRFVNTDLKVTPATATAPAELTRRLATELLVPLPPPAIATPTPFSPLYDTTSPYLIQYGMEYSPVAINEVLAYQFKRKETTGAVDKARMFIELVNTLTEAENVVGGTPTPASNLELKGWDFVIMNDTTLGRPDPFTGQIPEQLASTDITSIPIEPTTTDPAVPNPLAVPVPALPASGSPSGYYYVFGTETEVATASAVEEPLPPQTHLPSLATRLDTLTTEKYYWLYLRRPPNPFELGYNATSPNANRVVVDSFRFMYNKSTGKVSTADPNKVDPPMTANSEFLYSLQRRQPYRGGHAVPALPITTPATQLTAYGYSEQTVPAPSSITTVKEKYGKYGDNNQQITGDLKHTLGLENSPKDVWDYLPFHDRDFTSVAELLMVPGCPPGLFTKVFAEAAPPIPQSTLNEFPPPASASPADSPDPMDAAVTIPSPFGPPPPAFIDASAPHTFPYLVDNFFYTGAKEDPLPAPPLPAGATPPTPPHIGGPSGAGWFKMFEFLEVPSPANGAIGPVAQGQNFDWYRQDQRPGLLNLNLIIDEEVFFGLMGNIPLNLGQLTNAQVPRVVTQIHPNGTPNPNGAYSVKNVGYYDADPLTPGPNNYFSRMKAAFGDFLKLRHGGSGYLFAFGTGDVGAPGLVSTKVAAERPFHALSYPDINYTVMRPAPLPPSMSSTPPLTSVLPATPAAAAPPAIPSPTPPGFTSDPGVKNPYLFTRNDPKQPPPIPVRRLFQIPDNHGSVISSTPPPSNASTKGDPTVNTQTTNTNLANLNVDLTSVDQTTTPVVDSPYLGAGTVPDRRQHPYYRTEWLQKVTNLTTVRTQQYAVWITVGFFEVTQPGNPQLVDTDPARAADKLGLEVGARAGKNVRYRSFFLLDRTRAHGFNPSAPGDFRDVVTYRQRIQ